MPQGEGVGGGAGEAPDADGRGSDTSFLLGHSESFYVFNVFKILKLSNFNVVNVFNVHPIILVVFSCFFLPI